MGTKWPGDVELVVLCLYEASASILKCNGGACLQISSPWEEDLEAKTKHQPTGWMDCKGNAAMLIKNGAAPLFVP